MSSVKITRVPLQFSQHVFPYANRPPVSIDIPVHQFDDTRRRMRNRLAPSDPTRIGLITIRSNMRPGGAYPTDSVTMTVSRIGGGAPMTYAWYGPGNVLIPGQTGSSLTVNPAVAGVYKVTVTSPGATDSPKDATFTIVVVAPPVTSAFLMEDSGYMLMEDSGSILLEA